MANNVRFEPSDEGIKAFLNSSEMVSMLNEKANSALSKLGDGYEVSTMQGKTRANASIVASSHKAKRENSKSNTILKAVMGS
nr:MAG TPA: type I neck protein [Caudoviricetes sp.]